MKQLSQKTLEKRKLILRAVEDYFGEKLDERFLTRMTNAILRSQIGRLDPNEGFHAKIVKQNLSDKDYRIALGGSL